MTKPINSTLFNYAAATLGGGGGATLGRMAVKSAK